MRKIYIIISFIAAFFLVGTGIKLIAETRVFKAKTAGIKREVKDFNKKIVTVSKFKSSLPEEIQACYTYFYNNMSMLGSFNNVSVVVTIPEAEDRTNIEKAFRASCYAGVKSVGVKVLFGNIKKTSNISSILGALSALQIEEPVGVVSIKQDKNSLEILVDLYGV